MVEHTPERQDEVDRHFDRALGLTGRDRSDYLARLAAADHELAEAVESLLAATEHPDARLDPGQGFAGPLVHELLEGAAAPAPARAGEHVGAYRIVGEIGRGGMAVVYLAERADGAFQQKVALKLIRTEADSPELLRRFEQERQILASLAHPHIACLVDGGRTAGGLPYLAMEHVEGRPIDRYCDEERLSIDERIDLFAQVALAVQHAHRNLVVHRDLKPTNIVVTDDGQVKLLDFGIAKVLTPWGPDAVPLTRTMARVLTPEYSSPEQILGGPVTTASDVYQLGLLLYELLTGRRAQRIEDTSPSGLERAVCTVVPRRPSAEVAAIRDSEVFAARQTTPKALRRRLEGDLDTIVLEALRKEPERRYASSADMVDDLERWRRQLPVRAHPEALGYRARKLVRRHPVGASVAAALAFLLLAYAGTVTVHARQLERERDQVRVEARKAERVRELLVGLFQAADPHGDRGVDVTAGELLEAGADAVATTLAEEPEVRAEMLGVLGEVLHGLASYERSEELLEEALATQRRLHSGDHPDLAGALQRYGDIRRDRGDLQAAEELSREALAMRRRLFGELHPDVVESLDALGVAASLQGRAAEAEGHYREALDRRRVLAPGDDPKTATLLNNLSNALEKQERLAEAIAAQREALAMRRRLFAPEHPAISESLGNLGVALKLQGRIEEAEPLYREALAIRRRVFGASHPRIANSLNNLGELLRALGRFEEAAATQREALAIRRAAFGDRHANVGMSLHNLACALRDGGEAAEAERLFREALVTFRATLPEGHRLISFTTLALGRLLLPQGRAAEAEPLLREALAIRVAAIGEESSAAAEARIALGLGRLAQGRELEARELLVSGLAGFQATSDGDHALVAEARRALDGLPPVDPSPARSTGHRPPRAEAGAAGDRPQAGG